MNDFTPHSMAVQGKLTAAGNPVRCQHFTYGMTCLDFDALEARYAYEGRHNYGLVRAENGGIRMDEAHHSRGWEEGFLDGYRAGVVSLAADRDRVEDPYCRAENCEYRHWTSGSMPTHKRGSTCSPNPYRESEGK